MAIFSNQATLTYNGNSTNSNIAYGEILDVLTITKTAVEESYTPDSIITYVVTLRNTGSSALSGITLTDNLGAYDFGGTTVYPLSYVANTATFFINGTPQAAPAVTAGPPLVFTGINIPAGADAVLVYQAQAGSFAAPLEGSTIENTVTATGDGIGTDIAATETVGVATNPQLSISKSITPSQVVDNDRVTYTFIVENYGNRAVIATDNAAINDTFDPILTSLNVTFNGNAWTEGTQYTYDETTGVFATIPGQILVPAASFVQDPVTGAYTTTPGIATLTVTGTI
ncbi:MAG: hypothetical protein IKU24_04240 [Clostridia bacterium]|nr:hypothetical protein [Clostridia bacterium]